MKTLFRKLLLLEPSVWRFLIGSIACSCLISPSAVAQIIPDNTLGDESSVVVPDVEIKEIESDRLEGGAVRGNNLFHSFQEFNIKAGRGAYFANPAVIENIFSRVTGVNPSEIFGTLGVLGNANLFFINPNGIIFGENASLDLRGSFVGTTADSVVFPDGKEFNATNPGLPPLLTVNVQQPIGLKFEGEPGIITNAADLAVAARKSLSLSGNEVSTTGNLTAPGGKVEVLGIDSVALLESGTIDVSSATGGGTVLIGGDFQGKGIVPNAKRTYVDNNFTIKADALANGNGGKVIVWADEVTGFSGNISARGGLESGDGGLVEVSGKEHLIFRGNVDTSAMNGLPGTLLLDPTNIIIADGSGDESGDGTDTFAGNNSGVLGSILSTPLSEIDDTAPTTIYESELEGLSGDTNIVLQATNDITLQDLSDDRLDLAAGEGVITFSADADRDGMGNFVMEDNLADTIFTNGRDMAIFGASLSIGSINTSQQIGNSGSITLDARGDININGIVDTSVNLGDGGVVNITTGSLFLTNGAQILSVVNGEGNSGAIEIKASESVALSGESSQRFPSAIFSVVNSGAKGTAEGITIDTGSLSLTDGARLNASTFGVGDAGTIAITATDSIFLSGKNSQGLRGGIFSAVFPDAEGTAGGITIDTGSLSLIEGGSVSASTFGVGDAGEIAITATDSIFLSGEDSQGFFTRINSEVGVGAKGTAGGITIDTGSLSLTDGAVLSASTFGVGDAGAIDINTIDAIILSGESSQRFRSGIFSVVNPEAEGNSGVITINTGSLSLTNGAIVNSSTFGVGNAGNIVITATDAITLLGENSRRFASAIFSQVQSGAVGTAGGITIDTGSLSLSDGALVGANTFGVGNAGAISITATNTITLSGEDSIGFGSGIFSQVNPRAQGTAGGIKVDTGSLSLTDGAQLGASTFGAGNAGAISITATDTITLSGGDSMGFRSGIFSQVNPEAEGTAGGITIDTGSLSLSDGAEVSARTEGKGAANEIVIITNTLEVTSGSQIQTNTTTNFKAADITLDISDKLFLSGTNSGLFAETTGAGNAGNIIVNSPQLTIDQGASISAFTTARGDGGTITVNAPQAVLLTDNSQLTVETSGAGKPGDITITTPNLIIGKDAEISATATETSTNTERGGSITVNASNLDLTGKLGIFAETQGEAPAGTLNIQPDHNKPNLDIQFTDTAIISASTTASGQGGDINLTATETININGQGKVAVETTGIGNAGNINITTQNFNISQQTEISASTFSSGQAGSIFITADNFNLTEGAKVITNTAGIGKAGDIRFQITDSLNLVNSRIEASTEQDSSGDGGSIFIDPQTVTLTNSQIAVNSQGKGIGGNIDLQAGTLTLKEQSAIAAETASTDGGNIEMTIGGNLVLRDNSQITATAGTNRAGGNGGNIELDAQFILAFPTEDSDITANAFLGNGGNISITAEGILGIELREQETILSDITASSERGLAGTVEIDTPETDPNRGLVTLPQQAVDTQVALGCDVEGEGRVAFYNLGRGGLSSRPDDFLMADTIIGEWLPLAPSSESFSENEKLSFEFNDRQKVAESKPFVPVCWAKPSEATTKCRIFSNSCSVKVSAFKKS